MPLNLLCLSSADFCVNMEEACTCDVYCFTSGFTAAKKATVIKLLFLQIYEEQVREEKEVWLGGGQETIAWGKKRSLVNPWSIGRKLPPDTQDFRGSQNIILGIDCKGRRVPEAVAVISTVYREGSTQCQGQAGAAGISPHWAEQYSWPEKSWLWGLDLYQYSHFCVFWTLPSWPPPFILFLCPQYAQPPLCAVPNMDWFIFSEPRSIQFPWLLWRCCVARKKNYTL